MPEIKSNERELSGKVAQWFNEQISRGNFPFKSASNEPGIKVDDKTYFGDIVLWESDESRIAYSLIELKPPFGAAENLDSFRKKALKLKVKIAYTWNFQQLNAYKLDDNNLILLDSESHPILDKIDNWRRGDIQAQIKNYIRLICEEILNVNKLGKFSKFRPDKHYFISFLRDTVNQLIPVFEEFIRQEYRKAENREKITKYAYEQGISYPSDDDFYKLIASQTVYGLVTRIIFYLTIKRYFKDLPDLYDEEIQNTGRSIRIAFLAAREKDWQAVFVEGPIDELGIPDAAESVIIDMLANLNIYNFGELPEDVIGELFEELIEPGHRHLLGQYFTREDLVDFIIGTIVQNPDGYYADPTCGSGTFLIRLYNRLKYLKPQLKHHEILEKIWGIDIGKFPAELSTINLFRQDASNFENFPRVERSDIFDIFPGQEFVFPLPQSGKSDIKVKVQLPAFNGLVGNFPFIRQELLEKKIKGYKNQLTKVIAGDYLFEYPELFNIKNKQLRLSIEEKRDKTAKEKEQFITKNIDNKYLELNLSGQADIYTYIFIHASKLLATNGSFAIITSNSWLDVAYGSVLKKFFLDHFKIKMVVASWAEAWFEDAAVNTVFTVLEKCENETERKNHTVKFVKVKRPLSELIPHKLDIRIEYRKRWERIDTLVRIIEGSHFQSKSLTDEIRVFEDDSFRVRMMEQGILAEEIKHNGELSKWGKYLRAPDVYFEILEKCKTKLVPLKELANVRFGIKTGINEFFYLKPVNETKSIFKNPRNWEGFIEPEYLKKVIKSPKESDSIIIDPTRLKNYLFVCNKTKEELLNAGHTGALSYIEWGEKQRTKENVLWPDVVSVSGRKLWYGINYANPGPVLMPMINNERFIIYHNSEAVFVDHNLFEYQLETDEHINSRLAFLNSTLFSLIREVNSRVNLGEGATKTEGVDWDQLMLITKEPLKLKSINTDIFTRKILPINEEVRRKDRQHHDIEVLKQLGIDPDVYLKKIYDGIVGLVEERLFLPQLRKKQKSLKVKISYEDVKKSVIEECIGIKMKQFPEDFYLPGSGDPPYELLEFETYPTSGKPLKSEQFLGHYTLKDTDDQEILQTEEQDIEKFSILAAKPGHYELKIPKNIVIVKEINSNYQHYFSDLKHRLEVNAQQKLHSWSEAEKMVGEILENNSRITND